MKPSNILSELISSGVLEVNEQTDELRVTDQFNSLVSENIQWIDDMSVERLEQKLEKQNFSDEQKENISKLRENEINFVAILLALLEHVEKPFEDEIIPVILLLQQIGEQPPPEEGAPDSFFPINGDQLDVVVSLAESGIVYVWLDDCETCDIMKEEFNAIFPNPPENMGLFAIYGPDWAEHLHSNFNIRGGPATLFIKNGKIDSRLYGAHGQGKLEKEIEFIRNPP